MQPPPETPLPPPTPPDDDGANDAASQPPATPSNGGALPSDVARDGASPELVPDHAPELWEDGENSVTLLLRAAFTLLAGGFLLWCQSHTTFNQSQEWGRWIGLSVTANLLFPLFAIWMFFGQGLTHIPWLSDQKYNAWNYGWNWSTFKRHLLMSAIMFLIMLPALWFASRDAGTRAFYANYFPPVPGAGSWLYLFGTLTIYMFCWEWFFRGFLLFGIAQGTGAVVAIIGQAILFGLAHGTKPGLEMYSSFAGGLILGILCWREKSFVPAFLTHLFIHLAWAPLVLR
jgi:membrane protease YdiL (CAAX protease family)